MVYNHGYGACLRLYDITKTWFEANHMCKTLDPAAHVTLITSQQKQNALDVLTGQYQGLAQAFIIYYLELSLKFE